MNKKTEIFCIFFILISLILQSFIGMRHNAATYDELDHITSGYSKLVSRDFRLYTESPPFADMLFGLPLLFLNVTFPFDHEAWKIKNQNELSGQFFFVYNQNGEQMLFAARLIALLLSLITAFLLYFWMREWQGVRTALFTLFLYSFEPTIIAHSGLTMVDLPLMLFTVATFYTFWKWCKTQKIIYLLLSGVSLGLAQVSKFSAIFLFPMIGLLLFLFSLHIKKPLLFLAQKRTIQNIKNIYAKRITQILLIFLLLGFISYLIICTAYLFGNVGTPLQTALQEDVHLNKKNYAFVYELMHKEPLKTIGGLPNPIPYYYLKGFAFNVFEEKAKPKSTGIFSFKQAMETKPFGIFYTLISFLVKVPLVLVFLVLLFFLVHWKKTSEFEYIILLTPILFYFTWFGLSTRAGGVRYILPAFPFLFIFAAITWSDFLAYAEENKKKIMYVLMLLLIPLYAFSSLQTSPYYFSYYNEIVDVENAYTLQDGSLLMGQDWNALTTYLHENNISQVATNRLIWVEKRYFEKENISFASLLCGEKQEKPIIIKLTELDSCTKEIMKNKQAAKKIGNTIWVYQ